MNWLVDYWELWAIAGVAVALEWIAIRQGRASHRPTIQVRTISSRMWAAIRRYPWFTPLFLSFWVIVVPHFWLPPTGREWTTPEGWGYIVVVLGVVWWIYVKSRLPHA